MENKESMDREVRNSDVMFAAMRLGRALRRCPPEHGERPFPPAVGRMLMCIHENPGVSSRDLCYMLDLRRSTLSEMLGVSEADGWLTRSVDEEDKRLQHITLTDQGERMISGMEAARKADAEKKTSCFTEEEKAQFVALCDCFSHHLEKIGGNKPDFPGEHGPHGCPARKDREGMEFEGRGPGPCHPWEDGGADDEHRRSPFPSGARIRC